MSGDAVIEVRGLQKRFPGSRVPALDEVTTTMRAGTITGLVGPDGAGKTTFLRTLAGLLGPSAGEIRVLGLDPCAQSTQLREQIGYMPQKFGLYEDLSVLENLTLYADLRNVVGAEREATFQRLLAFTDLASFTDRWAGKLSGGMKQKLGLACSLLGHPKVLLLDEPGVGVDPISRRELWKMVRALSGDGMTVVWSTAYLDEAEQCDDVRMMDQGRIKASGSPQELMAPMAGRCFQITHLEGSPRSLLHRVLNAPEVIDGAIQGSQVRIVLREPEVFPDLALLGAGPQAAFRAVPARLEDAFISLLGGGPGGDSALAEVTQAKVPDPALDPSAIIQARNLCKRFGAFQATDDVSFQVARGEIFGLLGPNGAGKSTTFKMECGLLKPTSGQALVMGLNLEHSPSKARQKLGYMAQKFSLYGQLSVRHNLRFFAQIYGLDGAAQDFKVQQMVDTFDLEPYLDSLAGELPLGFKQRLALACAVMHEPQVLFLDEPTSGVDPVTRREFWNHIHGLANKGVTIIVTTHFMDEAEYCDRIGLVFRGRLIALGRPDDLKQRCATAERPDPTMEDAFIELILEAGS
ncbi:MAG: ATP-binding cassette domain-containing protein [Holophaga sp.]|nr:ATP-binding cassette domain-containing protein [Holophaga sp.]